MPKKVFVSGCYDLLHSGHVEFFKEASQYGDLYVGLGSDAYARTSYSLAITKRPYVQPSSTLSSVATLPRLTSGLGWRIF
ncbi:MAG: adenylyltransferase/cytidyltransferase family protein [Candidatus Cryptobacteroides sp.]|nr:adenylyltransferase/cytidyltransferase family protein [Bacteroidales bacterium]MEE3390962.1 adenylyltransferase/cytidyltransferase family protein [Candidatus Cryptobacteroides sp.]